MFQSTISMVADFFVYFHEDKQCIFLSSKGTELPLGKSLVLQVDWICQTISSFPYWWKILSTIAINPGIQCLLEIWLQCLNLSKNLHLILCALIWSGSHSKRFFLWPELQGSIAVRSTSCVSILFPELRICLVLCLDQILLLQARPIWQAINSGFWSLLSSRLL